MGGSTSQRRRGLAASLIGVLAVTLLAQPAAATFRTHSALLPPGSLIGPSDVAVDVDGNFFVLEYWGSRVRKYAPSGALLEEWGTGGSGAGEFSFPQSIATDSAGNVYVADTGNDRVQKFTGTGGYLGAWGGSGTADGQFTAPGAIAVDGSNRVYVADTGANNIQKFTATGGFLTKWGSPGSANGQLAGPTGIAADNAGNLYVLDAGNDRVQKFSLTGVHRKSWGSSGGTAGQFSDAWGVAVDHEGRVLVSESGFGVQRVQRFTPQGAYLATFAAAGELNGPRGLDVSADGMVHVADINNDGVLRFKAVPPDTAVTGPTGLIRDATPTFSFSSSQTPSAYECRLRGSASGFKVCSVPSYTTPSLDDGLQILIVRAVDTHGLVDPTPAEHEFRVDATPPQTWFEITPPASTTNRSPSFSFSASERGTFQCSLDGAAFAACTSPKKMPTLSYGTHTFKVRAKDRAGNLDPRPASHRFEVRA